MKKLAKALVMSGILALSGCSLSHDYYFDISKVESSKKEVIIYDRHIRADIKGKSIGLFGKDISIGEKQIYYIDLDEAKEGIESYVVLEGDKVAESLTIEELERKVIKQKADEDFKKLKKEGIRHYEVSGDIREKFHRVKSFLDVLLLVRQKQEKTPMYSNGNQAQHYTFEIFNIKDDNAYAKAKSKVMEDQFSDFSNSLYEIFWDRKLGLVKDNKSGYEYKDYGLDSFITGTWDSAEEGSKKCTYRDIAYKLNGIKTWKETSKMMKEHYESIISSVDNIFLERYGDKTLKFKLKARNFEYTLSYDYKAAQLKTPKGLLEELDDELRNILNQDVNGIK
ncbi:MAG: hypothetical protein Q8O03_07505 [Nanoarchaeota archaeon]|nr:hypothetical protein [Nanoarchaeota archaeon]